jgi:hypothetical protein
MSYLDGIELANYRVDAMSQAKMRSSLLDL